MQGLYLWTKMQLLISFYLLKPLWAGLAWLLSMLGLQAPSWLFPSAQPAQPEKQAQAPRTFHSIGTVTKAAMRLRKAAAAASARQGVVLETSLTHDAAIIVERRTLNRAFPNGRAVLRKLFKKVELQEACFTDTVVLFRRKVESEKGSEGSGGRKAQELEQAAQAHNIHIKHFKKIPLADLEMVMPEKHIYVPPSVFLQLAVAVVVAIGGLVWTLASAEGGPSWGVLGSAVVLLFTRASQVYLQAQSERSEIEREMNKLLFDRTAASQEAVLHTLTEEMTRQRIRELFVCYCVLLLAGRALSDEELDRRCERLLCKHFGLRIDFTAEEAIPALLDWGLVQRQPAANQAKQQMLSQAGAPQGLPAAATEKAGVGRMRAAVAAAAQGWGKASAATIGRGLQRVKVKADSNLPDGSDNIHTSPSGSPRLNPKAPSVLGRRLSGLSREGSGSAIVRAEPAAVGEEKGDLLALPLDQALVMLDKAWDSVFDFHNGSKDTEVPSDTAGPPQEAVPTTSRLAVKVLSGDPGSADPVGSSHHRPSASGSSNRHHSHHGSASSQQGSGTRPRIECSPVAAGTAVVEQVRNSALAQFSPFTSSPQPGRPCLAEAAWQQSDGDMGGLQHGASLTPVRSRAAASLHRHSSTSGQVSSPRLPKPQWHEATCGNAEGLQKPAWASVDEEALIPAEESREALEGGFSRGLAPFTVADLTAGDTGAASCRGTGAEWQMPSGQDECQELRKAELVILQEQLEEEEPQWRGEAGLVEQHQTLAPKVEASAQLTELALNHEGGSALPAERHLGETWEEAVQEQSVGNAAASSMEDQQPSLGQVQVGDQSPANQAWRQWEQGEGSGGRSQSESESGRGQGSQVEIAHADSEDAVWLATDESREGLLLGSGVLPQAGASLLPAQYHSNTAQPSSPWSKPTCQDFTQQQHAAPSAEPATSPGSSSPASNGSPSSELRAPLASAEAAVAGAMMGSPAAASAKPGSPGATSRGGSTLQRSSSRPSSRQVAQVRGMWEQRVKSSSLPPSPKLQAAPQVRPFSAGPAYALRSLGQSPARQCVVGGVHAARSPPWEQQQEFAHGEEAARTEWGREAPSAADAPVEDSVSSSEEVDWYADHSKVAEQDGLLQNSKSQGRPNSANLPVRRSLAYGSGSIGWLSVEGRRSTSALAGRLSRPTSPTRYIFSPRQPATDWSTEYEGVLESWETEEPWRQPRVSPRAAMAASPVHHHHTYAAHMQSAELNSSLHLPGTLVTIRRSCSDAGPGFAVLRSPLDWPLGEDAPSSQQQRPHSDGSTLVLDGSYSPRGSPASAGSHHSPPLSPGSGAGRAALLKLLRLRTELAAKRAHRRHSRSSSADEVSMEAFIAEDETLAGPAAREATSTASPRTAGAALAQNTHSSPRIGSRIFHSYSPGHGFYVERP